MSYVDPVGLMSGFDASWLATQIELSDAALVGVDLARKVVFWSHGAEALFGWTADDVLGQPPPIMPRAQQREWQLQIQHVLESGRPTPAAAAQRITRDGRAISVVQTSAPARDFAGKITGVLDVVIDSTGLRQIDEESRLLAQVRERELVAMDLHDGLIQSLYGVVLNLAAQEQALDDTRATDALKSARSEVERAIAETRAYVGSLSARASTPRDVGAELALLANGLRANAGIDVRLTVDANLEPPLPGNVRGHLLYLAHEAVSNVLRHASASRVTIAFLRGDGGATLRVVDNGRGFVLQSASDERHRGLHNMAERARLVGGELTIDSTPGGGTVVALEVPL